MESQNMSMRKFRPGKGKSICGYDFTNEIAIYI